MSSGPPKPVAGVKAPAQDKQKSKSDKDTGALQKSGESGGADAQVGAASAAFLGVLPVFSQADTDQDTTPEDAEGAPSSNAPLASSTNDRDAYSSEDNPSQDAQIAVPGGRGATGSAATSTAPPLSLDPYQVSDRGDTEADDAIEAAVASVMANEAGGNEATPDAAAAGSVKSAPGSSAESSDKEADEQTGTVMTGGAGNDTFVIPDGFASDTIIGGEGGSDIDEIDASAPSGPVTVTYTADEAGTIFDGTETLSFSEVERLTLTEGADSVDAQSNAVTTDFHIDTGAGNDTISGFLGDETVLAGAGDDQAFMGGGNDSVEGGAGDDQIWGHAGDDVLRGGADNDTLYGGAGDDTLSNQSGADSLSGGDDADTFQLAEDFDGTTVTGGEGGNDQDKIDVSGGSGPVTVSYTGDEEGSIANGTDTLSFSEVEQLTLSDQDDAVDATADSAGVDIAAGAGDDTIQGGLGNDTLDGGAGVDSIVGGEGDDIIDGGAGSDTAQYNGNLTDFSIVYDSATDTFTITDLTLAENLGSDTVTGVENFQFDDGTFTATDLQIEADRQANAAPTDILVSGGTVNETVSDGGSFAAAFDPSGQTVATLTAVDSDTGDSHSFSLISDASGKFEVIGNEIRLRSGQEVDFETDTSFALTIRTFDQFGEIYDEVLTINVADFEGGYTAGNGGESITGTSEEDVISGGTGADVITAGDGADTVDGGDGADQFILDGDGGQGNVFSGGDGDDTLHFEDGSGATTVTFDGPGSGSFTTAAGETGSFSGIEAITGTDLDDQLDASAETGAVNLNTNDGDDTAIGGAGDDTLDGDGGNDRLFGGVGNDQLHADGGDDSLSGGDNDDTLYAGTGNDTLDGGDGNDFLEVDGVDGTSTVDGGAGHDTLDFDSSGGTVSVTFNGDNSGTFTMTDGASGVFSNIEEIHGTENSDSVNAGADTDGGSYNMGNGDDTVVTGAGDDYVDADGGDDSVSTGAGDDTVTGDAGADTIAGGAGADDLQGGSDGDTFVIEDGFGNDTIVGGEGGTDDDVIDMSAMSGPVTVTYTGDEEGTITDGSDTIAFSEVERLILADQADTIDASTTSSGLDIDAGDGENTITGGSGADTIVSGNDADLINSGDGDDVIFYGDGDNTVNAGDGNDRVDDVDGNSGFTGANTIDLGDGNDTAYSGFGNDTILGGDGDDQIFSQNGDDNVDGGAGNDSIDGGWGDDSLQGGTGADTLTGAGGNDTLAGGDGDDLLDGGDDDDSFVVEDGFGNDTIIGGEGGTDDDVIDLSALTGPVTVTYSGDQEGTITDGTDTITFSEVERLILTDYDDSVNAVFDSVGVDIDAGAGNDTMTGGSGNDSLYGQDGADVISGGSGDDSILGGADNDTIDGGIGDDYIEGGTGLDLITVGEDGGTDTIEGGSDFGDTLRFEDDATGSGVTVNVTGAGTGSYDFDGTTAAGAFSGIERVEGTSNDDVLDATGSSGSTGLAGGAGNDTVLGGSGWESLNGDDGDDVLSAGAGNDDVRGGSGNDTLRGGTGDDNLFGNDGADTFVVEDGFGDDTVTGGEGGTDTDIVDFSELSGPVSVTYTGNEEGTITDGTDTITFSEVEELILSDHADVVDATNGAIPDVSATPLIQMRFEDGATGTATDTSGNNHDGIYQGNASAGGTGLSGNGAALVLDGSGDYVEIPDSPDFDLAEGTISMSFNADTLGTKALFSRDSTHFDDGGHIYATIKSDGSVELRIQTDSSSEFARSDPGVVTAGEWHHFTATFGPDGMHVYIDGVEVATDTHTGGIAGNDEPWTIGANQWKSGDATADNLQHFFDGEIDNFTVYGEQLDASDVALLNSGSTDDGTTVYAGAGDDTITGSAGADFFDGGDDADTFIVEDAFANDTIAGGEGTTTGTDDDVIDLSALTGPVTVTYTGDEEGTITDGSDTITFSDVEQLVLTDYADSVDMNEYRGAIVAGDGDDTITGISNGTVDAGDGDDFLEVDHGAGTVDVAGGTGTDTLNFSGDFTDGVEVTLSAAEDGTYNWATAGSGAFTGIDDYDLTAQDDTFDGSAAASGLSVAADTGNDTVTGGTGDDTLFGEADQDSLIGGDGADDLYGGSGHDTLEGDAGDDSLEGGDGNDMLDGGADADTLIGGSGDDSLLGDDGTDSLYGGSDEDTLEGGAGDDVLEGGDGNDTLLGDAGADSLVGGSDDDVLQGGDDADTLEGGTGNDSLTGDAGDDNLTGGEDEDTLEGGEGDDVLDGGLGNDTLSGDAGNDSLSGNSGDDVLIGDTDDNLVINGSFENFVATTTTANGATSTNVEGWVDANGATLEFHIDGTRGVEATDGTYWLDTTENNASSVDISQTIGLETGENYLLSFDAGSSNLPVSNNLDVYFGGIYVTTIDPSVANVMETYQFDLVGGSGDGSNTLRFVAEETFNAIGVSLDNVRIVAAGEDTLVGGTGNDSLSGGAGDDILQGGSGDDTIALGLGDDLLEGEEGADTFLGSDNFGNDTIVGGESGSDDDVVDLSGVDASVTVTYAGVETGDITDGTDTIAFSEVERLTLTDHADVVDGSASIVGIHVDAAGGDDTITGSSNGGPNLITNGTFDSDLSGWTVNNPTGGAAPSQTGTSGGAAAFNSSDEATYGDSIEQSFASNTGASHNVTLDLSEPNNPGVGDHTFQIDILDDNGNVIATETQTVSDDATATVSFDFTAVSETSTIRITNTTSTNSASTDGLVDNVVVKEVFAAGVATGNDTISGGDGNDSIASASGDDSVDGGAGADTIDAGAGDDTLAGGSGADLLDGGDDSDTFVVEDGFGSDTLIGGEGGIDADVIDLSRLSGPVTVTYTGNEEGTITNGTDTLTFSEIERLILTDQADVVDASSDNYGIDIDAGAGNDTITGTNQEDMIVGGAGEDVIYGKGDDDTVEGGDGSDRLLVSSADGGATNIYTDNGATGMDTLVLESAGANETFRIQGDLSADDGFEVIDGSGVSGEMLGTYHSVANFDFSNITLIDVDEISGTNSDDSIIGSASDDSILGADGHDVLSGGAGDDTLVGGDGDDTLSGGDGDDVFFVAAMQGNDVVEGGAGASWTDTLTLDGMGAAATDLGGGTVDGDGWTLVLDGGHSVTSLNSGILELSSDASGVVTFDDGGTVTFADVERVTW